MQQQLALVALIFQAIIPWTAGHGNIIVPQLEGNAENPFFVGGPAGTIEMAELVGNAPYGEYFKAVDDWFTDNQVASLKEFITTYGTDIAECGNTKKDGKPQPVPSDGFAQHDTLGNSHPGPCEIWCDSTRVFHDLNCVDTFSGQSPAKIPIDVAVCKSSSVFAFYWLALHNQPWQVYINCVALDGSGATSSGSATSTSTPKTAPVVPTEVHKTPSSKNSPAPASIPSTKCVRRHS